MEVKRLLQKVWRLSLPLCQLSLLAQWELPRPQGLDSKLEAIPETKAECLEQHQSWVTGAPAEMWNASGNWEEHIWSSSSSSHLPITPCSIRLNPKGRWAGMWIIKQQKPGGRCDGVVWNRWNGRWSLRKLNKLSHFYPFVIDTSKWTSIILTELYDEEQTEGHLLED